MNENDDFVTHSDTQDQPADTQDQPADTQDQPADTQDQPADTQDQPADTQDQPADTQDQPADNGVEENLSPEQMYQEIRSELEDWINAYNIDIIVYNGDMLHENYDKLRNAILERYGYVHGSALDQKTMNRMKEENRIGILVLITSGGYAEPAFNCARLLQNLYRGGFWVYVPTLCKSAGTIVCLGADRLIMSEYGQLGPIDVQIPRIDGSNPRLPEQMSGTEATERSAITRRMAIEFYKDFIAQTYQTVGDKKLAVEAARDIVIGLFQTIYQKFDVESLGLIHRQMSIAHDYGSRLAKISNNVKENAIEKLLYGYPDHGQIIDFKEAGELFKDVSLPVGTTHNLNYLLTVFNIDWRRNEFIGMLESLQLRD